jgi:hypothetical protein
MRRRNLSKVSSILFGYRVLIVSRLTRVLSRLLQPKFLKGVAMKDLKGLKEDIKGLEREDAENAASSYQSQG